MTMESKLETLLRLTEMAQQIGYEINTAENQEELRLICKSNYQEVRAIQNGISGLSTLINTLKRQVSP